MSEHKPASAESKVSPETIQLFKDFVEARTFPDHSSESEHGHRSTFEGRSKVTDESQLTPVDCIRYRYSKWYDADGKEDTKFVDFTISTELEEHEILVMFVSDTDSEGGISYRIGDGAYVDADDTTARTTLTNIEAGEVAGKIAPAQ